MHRAFVWVLPPGSISTADREISLAAIIAEAPPTTTVLMEASKAQAGMQFSLCRPPNSKLSACAKLDFIHSKAPNPVSRVGEGVTAPEWDQRACASSLFECSTSQYRANAGIRLLGMSTVVCIELELVLYHGLTEIPDLDNVMA